MESARALVTLGDEEYENAIGICLSLQVSPETNNTADCADTICTITSDKASDQRKYLGYGFRKEPQVLSLPKLPGGFRYQSELINSDDEDTLLARVRELPFRD